MAHPPCASRCQPALLGRTDLFKIAHPEHPAEEKRPAPESPRRLNPERSPAKFSASQGRHKALFSEAASPDSRRPQTRAGRQERVPVPDCPTCFSPSPALRAGIASRGRWGAGTPSPFASTTQPSMLRFRRHVGREVADIEHRPQGKADIDQLWSHRSEFMGKRPTFVCAPLAASSGA